MDRIDKLLKEYKKGNAEVFDEIYDLTKETVFLSIYSIIKSKPIIDDLMQDTYMKALEKIELYKIGTNFKAWIARIGRNTALNFYKRKQWETLVDPSDNAIEDAKSDDKSSDNRRLYEALSLLDEDEKPIFIYRIVLGFNYREIDEIMGLAPRQSQYLFQKIVQKLRKQIGD